MFLRALRTKSIGYLLLYIYTSSGAMLFNYRAENENIYCGLLYIICQWWVVKSMVCAGRKGLCERCACVCAVSYPFPRAHIIHTRTLYVSTRSFIKNYERAAEKIKESGQKSLRANLYGSFIAFVQESCTPRPIPSSKPACRSRYTIIPREIGVPTCKINY